MAIGRPLGEYRWLTMIIINIVRPIPLLKRARAPQITRLYGSLDPLQTARVHRKLCLCHSWTDSGASKLGAPSNNHGSPLKIILGIEIPTDCEQIMMIIIDPYQTMHPKTNERD